MDLSKWNVSKVIQMNDMFSEARDFNQSLCSWYTMLNGTTDVHYMFENSGCLIDADPVLGVSPKVATNATRSDQTEYNFCTPCYAE